MDNVTKTLIRYELTELDKVLDGYSKKHNLSEEAMLDIKSYAQAKVSRIIHILDKSEPYASLAKFED